MYLRYMVERLIPRTTLRLSNVLLLKVPGFKNKTLSARTFGHAADDLWNRLSLGHSCC